MERSYTEEWQLVKERERLLIKELLPNELLSRISCLTDQDKEQIQADETNHGPIHASTTLIERLRRRGPEAFSQFVCALRENGFSHIAQIIDPRAKHEVNSETSYIKQNELVCFSGDVTDLRIEVNIKYNAAENAVDLERLLCEFYDNSKKPEVQEMRIQFIGLIDQETKHHMNFVKIIKTETSPLVLVFRLSKQTAAERLWSNFNNGKLTIMVKKCLSSFEAIKSIFDEDKNVDIEVNIKKDEYEKVLKTLCDSKNVAVLDGEEKKEFALKDFQVKLGSGALQGENTIICSPTGSGKTFVAMEVMKKHLRENEKKKIVFVVWNVSLVQQQRQRFDTYLPEGVKVSSLCGNSLERLSNILKENDVVVLTAQVLVNALKGNDITISQLSLLVFDECHHTIGKTPYSEIMWWYLKTMNSHQSLSLPQVLGLSASLGIGTGNSGCSFKAEEHILDICANLDAHSLKVSDYSKTNTDIQVRPVSAKVSSTFETVVNEAMKEVEEIFFSSSDLIEKTSKPPFGSQSYDNWIVNVQKKNLGRDLMTCAEHLNEYNNALLINEEVRPQSAIDYLCKNIEQKTATETEKKLSQIYKKVYEAVHSDLNEGNQPLSACLQELEEHLLEKFANNAVPLKVIIFVGTRFIASALVDWIKDSPKFKDIKPSYVLGGTQRKAGMTKTKQDEEIKKFREGIYNVIVATSTLLEGIDIPDCNLVINYNMPGNEITYVQAKGRVRAEGSYIVIVSEKKKSSKERDFDKAKVMKEAVSKIESIPVEEFQQKVKQRQEAAYKERLSLQDKENGEGKPLITDEIKLLCKKCGVFACKAKDIKLYYGVHHLVPHYKQTLRQVKLENINPKNIHGDLVKVAVISCQDCDLSWGNMSRTMYGEFPVLKIKQFRVQNGGESEGVIYRGWKDFPYQLEAFPHNEIIKPNN